MRDTTESGGPEGDASEAAQMTNEIRGSVPRPCEVCDTMANGREYAHLVPEDIEAWGLPFLHVIAIPAHRQCFRLVGAANLARIARRRLARALAALAAGGAA